MAIHPRFADAVAAMAAKNCDKHVIGVLVSDQDVLPGFGINTPLKIAHFLAQASHESGGFKIAIENMNYSAKRLMAVWPKRFPTAQAAAAYAGNPQKLANFVYANRMGNGASSSGDGFRYRGRGLLQLTGRSMYRGVAQLTTLPLEDQPELAEHFENCLRIAAGAWKYDGVDKLPESATVERYTQKINGGQIGIDDRKKRFERVRRVMGL